MSISIEVIKNQTAEGAVERLGKYIKDIEEEIHDASQLGHSFVSFNIPTALLLTKEFSDGVEEHFRLKGFRVDTPNLEFSKWTDTVSLVVSWFDLD